jgi:hypothetical protein
LWQGFDWYAPTQNISSLNTLGLAGLSASTLSVSEGGSESFTLAEGNALATVQGNGTQPLADLSQTGQQSYADTASDSFALTNHGSNNFALTELGTSSGSAYALSSVTYNETGGVDSIGLTETVVESVSGTATTSGNQSFAGSNHTLGASASDSFQFTSLKTAVYGESDSGGFSDYEGGTYGGGSFALGSLSYSNQGSGTDSLTETANQTQTGTLTGGNNFAGTDSMGVAGTLTGADTVSQSGNFTQTAGDTLTETGSGNYTLTEGGAYAGNSFSMSSFNLA